MATTAATPRVLASTIQYLPNPPKTHPTQPPRHKIDVTANEEEELCKCVAWLEDRKIRLYDIEQRAPLRNPGAGWDAAFQQVCVRL